VKKTILFWSLFFLMCSISSNVYSQTTLLTGTVLVVNKENKAEQQFQWELYVDEDSLEITAEINLFLSGGIYDFYLLMADGQKQYAAIANSRLAFDGQNAIPFLIHPVIGDFIQDIHILRDLDETQLLYDNNLVSGFENPAIGISIDSEEEQVFSIGPNIGLCRMFIYLPADTYTFSINVYDGTQVKYVLSDSQTTITITESGGSIPLDLVPVDSDGDSLPDIEDNCPDIANPNQEDADTDSIGDACDTDTVYGYIKDIEGAAIADVTVEIVRVNCGNAISVEASTNALGYYAYGGLESSYTYFFVASKPLYSFALSKPSLSFFSGLGVVTIPQTEIQSYDFTEIED